MRTSPRTLASLLLLAVAAHPFARAADPAPPTITVDVPVKLDAAKVVFDLDHPAFQGDVPFGIAYMGLFADRLKEQRATAHLVGVFYGAAGYMLLDDAAYGRARRVKTGNPYKAMLADLLAKGVRLEECANTMRANGWTNQDLLPGVQVNAGAVLRLVQLQQQGYAVIHP